VIFGERRGGQRVVAGAPTDCRISVRTSKAPLDAPYGRFGVVIPSEGHDSAAAYQLLSCERSDEQETRSSIDSQVP
jgi:hypothetical protein